MPSSSSPRRAGAFAPLATFAAITSIALILASCATAPGGGRDARQRQLLVIMDGLRPDQVTRDLTPNLHRLARRGVTFANHHAALPGLSLVNAASISTGGYLKTHGVLGEFVYPPGARPDEPLPIEDAATIIGIEAQTGRPFLTAPTMARALAEAGLRFMVFSGASSGAAYLLNPNPSLDSATIAIGLIQPDSIRAGVENSIGIPPQPGRPSRYRNEWAVNAYISIGLDEVDPDVAVLWLNDPDDTQHAMGVGSPAAVEALRRADAELGRAIDALEERGMLDTTNILVASDHGFSTLTGQGIDLQTFLIEGGFKASPTSSDVLVAGAGITVEGGDRGKIREIIVALQREDWVGGVFTHRARPGHPEGFVPGTLSFHSIHAEHARVPDIGVAPRWLDTPNEFGYPGLTMGAGVAGHGTASRHDLHATLIAAGPGIKRGAESSVPTANYDLAPTLLHLAGVEPPDTMDGRILGEALRGGPAPGDVRVRRIVHGSRIPGEDYLLEMLELGVGATDYFSYAKLLRGADAAPMLPPER